MEIAKKDFYIQEDKMNVATDCIIFGFDSTNLKLLIFKRKIKPMFGKWSLIGSFVKLNEDVGEAVKRVLKETTGLENVFVEELKSYGAADRNKDFRCISIAQYALIRISDYDGELAQKYDAHWYGIDKVPNLVMDHNQMVADGLKRLKRKVRFEPIGFELLPKKFTIPQLRRLYEAIYQKELDRGNFRKKVLSLKVLVKLDESDNSTFRRSAFLYKFDYKIYQKLLITSYKFEIS